MQIKKEYLVNPKTLPILYHISFKDYGSTIWNPLNPAGSEDIPEGDEDLGEPLVPRICVSPTLEQCFRAVWLNVDKFFKKKKYPHMDFHVYSPSFKGQERVIPPDVLTNERWVWDAHVTQEHWILTPTIMEKIGWCRFYNTLNKGLLYTRVFNDPKEKKSSEAGPTHIKFSSNLDFEKYRLFNEGHEVFALNRW